MGVSIRTSTEPLSPLPTGTLLRGRGSGGERYRDPPLESEYSAPVSPNLRHSLGTGRAVPHAYQVAAEFVQSAIRLPRVSFVP